MDDFETRPTRNHNSRLPPEMMDQIGSSICRKPDLRNFILANKTCHESALPHLYNEVKIDIHDSKEQRVWLNMLVPENKGLLFIRRLRFGERPVTDVTYVRLVHGVRRDAHADNKMTEAVLHVAYQVLALVPQNALHELSPPLLSSLPLLWYEKSLRSQQHLRSAQIRPLEQHCVERDIIETLRTFPESFAHCKRLEVYPRRVIDLQLIGALLPKVCKVHELQIFPHRHLFSDQAFQERTRKIGDLQLDFLQQAAFCPRWLQPGTVSFPNLRRLTLVSVPLEQSAAVYAKYIDFEVLECLELRDCANCDTFLHALFLARTMEAPRLSKLTISHRDSGRNLVKVVDDLLRNRSFIDLDISLRRASRLLAIASIWKQIASLQSLKYDGYLFARKLPNMRWGTKVHWPPEEMERLTTELSARRIAYSLPTQEYRWCLATSSARRS